MKKKITGIILASGEGSRVKELSEELNVPKHLFPLKDNTPVGLQAKELLDTCDEVLVIAPRKHQHLFEEEFGKLNFPIKVIPKKGSGFQGDYQTILDSAKYEHVFFTVGDLIFPHGEIKKMVKKEKERKRNKYVLYLDKEQLFKRDVRIVGISLTKTLLSKVLTIDPESYFWMILYFFRFLLFNRITLGISSTLFNINTNKSYQMAKNHFYNK